MDEEKTTTTIFNLPTIIKHQKLPATTAHEARTQIFQATGKPSVVKRVFTTAWGRVYIEGRLGQQHEDVLEAIFWTAERVVPTEDGQIKLLVDPAKIRKVSQVTNPETLKRMLIELRSAVIEIQEPAHLRCIGGLIDYVDLAVKSDGTTITKPNPFGGKRPMWRVIIGKALMTLLERDILLYRDPTPIAKLSYSISKAVARFVKSHRDTPNGGWPIDTVIKAVASKDNNPISNDLLRKYRERLRKDKEKLKKLNIVIDGNRIKLDKTTKKMSSVTL